MSKIESGGSPPKPKRRKYRAVPEVAEQEAAAFGISVPPMSGNDERFISPNDVAKVMNVSGESVKQWIYRGKLPAVRLTNGYWKVRIADLEGFLKARNEIGRKCVLITDGGNSGVGEVVSAVEALNLKPVVAHNYSDALLKALDHFPALFVIYISQNDPGCWKFAETIRSNKALRSIPFLFIADKSISDAETDCALKYEAKGILLRPLAVDVVKSEIDGILKNILLGGG